MDVEYIDILDIYCHAVVAGLMMKEHPILRTIFYLLEQDKLPIGYRRAIRRYIHRRWDLKDLSYSQNHLIKEFMAVDKGEVFFKAKDEMADPTHEP